MGESTSQRARSCCSQCFVPTCDFRGPCKFPHGCCYSILGLFSAIGGLMMNIYVLHTCLFQRIHRINYVTGDPIPGQERGYGFFSRETDHNLQPDYQQCSWYTQEEYDSLFDGWMHSGRIFAIISAILASVCFLVMFLTCCMAFSPSMFERWLFWMYIIAAITIAFSFLIFGSEFCSANKCKVADGSGWAISAFMFHLVAANTVKSFAGANAPSNNNGNDDDDVDEELDDLYYEDEDEKYPPFRPEGPRGVVPKEYGPKEYNNGEDYYDDLGRMIDPFDDKGKYKDELSDEDDDDDDLSDIDSDDLDSDDDDDDDDDEYMSDFDDDEEAAYKNGKGDLLGDDGDYVDKRPPSQGNLGVGYEDEEDEQRNPSYQQQNGGEPVGDYDQDAYANPYDPKQSRPASRDNDDGGGPAFA